MRALIRFSRVVLACLAVLAAGVPTVASAVVRDEVVQVERARPEVRTVARKSADAPRVESDHAAPTLTSRSYSRRLFILNRALLR